MPMNGLNDVLASPATAAALAAALTLLVAALALGLASARREEVRAALASLSAMKWREFAHHVAGVLAQRGLRPDGLEQPGQYGFDLRMTRGAARYLVQCRQVGERPLDLQSVHEFAALVRLQGAAGGILVSTGGIDSAARRAATQSGIELLSGYQLWRQLEPLLPLDLVREIRAAAAARRARRALAALAVAVAIGAAVFVIASVLGHTGAQDAAPVQRAPAPAATPPAATPPAAAPPAAAPPAAAPSAAGPAAAPPAQPQGSGEGPRPTALPTQMPDPSLTEQQLAARRAAAERDIRALPDVADAAWSTRSTLLLTLDAGADAALSKQAIAAACDRLVRYEELRYTRLQVQAGSDGPGGAHVRWRQCR